MSLPLRRRLEDAFVEALEAHLGDTPVLAGGKTEDYEPPYVIVRCRESSETTPKSGAHKFDLRIVMVSLIDDSTSAAHDERVSAIQTALDAIPRYANDPNHGVQLCGWSVVREESATEEQSYGDVFFLEGGAVLYPEGAGEWS